MWLVRHCTGEPVCVSKPEKAKTGAALPGHWAASKQAAYAILLQAAAQEFLGQALHVLLFFRHSAASAYR